jgi:hypothetical protein
MHYGGKQMSTAAPTKTAKGGYDVPRPGGKCAVSGRDIAPGEKFIAAVRESGTGLERLDVALDAWKGFDRANLLGYWQTTMPHPEEKKKVFVDDQVLCELFGRLANASEPGKINFRFMLALVLMRKRLIVYEESCKADGRDLWVVRMKGREDRLNLIDPHLNEQEMAEVSHQLGQILNEEL